MKHFLQHNITLLFLIGSLCLMAQPQTERLTMVTYNLLYYRQTTTFCDATQNSSVAKDGYMRTIFNHIQPDIIAAQEIGANPVNLDRILTNVLNVNGVTSWQHAPYESNGFSNIVNGLFYNGAKVGHVSTTAITRDVNNNSLVRSIDLHRLYYKDSLLGFGADTIFFTVGVAHLKAGSTGQDQLDRAAATLATMQHIQVNVPDENRFFAGDFNVRASTETSFQNLINYSNAAFRFLDPINRLGTWYQNPSFSDIHTQSTRTNDNTNGGCFSGGGMDDRLDFILTTSAVMNGTSGMQYVPNSYKTVGQDGIRYNRSLIDSTFAANNSVPFNVLMALFNMSDHLPVSMQLDVTRQTVSTPAPINPVQFNYNNPATDQLFVALSGHRSQEALTLAITDLTGKEVLTQVLRANTDGKAQHTLDVSALPRGLYLLQVRAGAAQNSRKLILQ
jgi:endonuclease/exonuclease/phosphatase family metal-dependent hydrolase